jgi:hypothetical protein
METCATDNNGSYASCDKPTIINIEPTLNDAASRLTVTPNGTVGYTVTVASSRNAAVTFSIVKTNGATDRQCTVGSQEKGGCPNPGAAGNDW